MRKLASIRTVLGVSPIDGADKIEAVQIDGWQCVAKKGEFQPGDLCCYFEIDSFLPAYNPAFDFLMSRGKQTSSDGIEGYRLRTAKLRGTISQGLALPVSILFGSENVQDGDDVTERLGVTKWEPVLPASLGGEAKGVLPCWIHKTDQERIQNIPQVLDLALVYEVSVKLDGSSMTIYHRDGETGVCSRNIDLRDAEGNTFWQVAKRYGLPERLASIGNFAIQGELIGPGIQGNKEKLKAHELYVFDVWLIDEQRYATPTERYPIVELLGLKHVPVLHYAVAAPSSVADALNLAEGSSLNPEVQREGLVFKSLCGTVSWKAISNKWLLKNE